MKKNKKIIVLGFYTVALMILIISSIINPHEKYFVALLVMISFPFFYKRFRENQKEKIN
jgi:hypothetical protein